MVTAVQSPEDQESHPQNGHDPRTDGHTINKLYWKTQVPLRTRETSSVLLSGGQLTQSSVDLSMVHSCSASHAKPETGSEQWIPVLQPFAGAIYLPYYT